MSTISSFKGIENNHDVYRGKDCMKVFCEYLKEHAERIINFIKNEINNKETARSIWKWKKFAIFTMKILKINILLSKIF